MGKARKKSDSIPLAGGMNLRRVALKGAMAAALLGGCGFAFHRMEKYVAGTLAFPGEAIQVVLKDRPAWMSDALALQIASAARPGALRSSMDHDLLKETTQALQLNPWVRNVRQVRRTFGKTPGDTIEISCEYRAPVALVASRGQYVMVDGEGVKLPEKFAINAQQAPAIMFGPDGHITLRVIEGVATLPPFTDGQKWPGEDLQAGLDLVKLLYGRACTDEIHRVNVSNFKGRRNGREPQLTLITRYNSEIRWGEAVRQNFYAELHPTEKLERLAFLKERLGRVDGGYSWIDIRLENILHPKQETPVVQAGHPGAVVQ